MKGIYQRGVDDCVAACLASIFEIRLGDIPPIKPDSWWGDMLPWLNGRGVTAINITLALNDPAVREQLAAFPGGFCIGCVESTRFPGSNHAVVCHDWRIVWDPYEGTKPGTDFANEYTVLYPLDFSGWVEMAYGQEKRTGAVAQPAQDLGAEIEENFS